MGPLNQYWKATSPEWMLVFDPTFATLQPVPTLTVCLQSAPVCNVSLQLDNLLTITGVVPPKISTRHEWELAAAQHSQGLSRGNYKAGEQCRRATRVISIPDEKGDQAVEVALPPV